MAIREPSCQPSETFGAMLRRFRMARPGYTAGNRHQPAQQCLSQSQLAHAADIDSAYVCRLEKDAPCRGEYPQVPSRAVVHSLARALRCDPLATDRLMIAAGYWPWDDQEDIERALGAVHGDFYGRKPR